MTGTLEAFARRKALDERTHWYLGHLFTYLVNSEETGGQYALIEALVRAGFEPPPHTHSREDELFIVHTGEITMHVGDQVIEATPGTAVFMPRGLPHGFRLRTPTAHVHILITPGGLEEYFKVFGEPAKALELPPVEGFHPDITRLIAVGQRYGIEFLPPPA